MNKKIRELTTIIMCILFIFNIAVFPILVNDKVYAGAPVAGTNFDTGISFAGMMLGNTTQGTITSENDPEPEYEGDKCAYIASEVSNGQPYMHVNFSNITDKVLVEYKIRMDSTDPSMKSINTTFTYRGEGGGSTQAVRFTSEGAIETYDYSKSAFVATDKTYSFNTWYHVSMVFDIVNSSYDAYLNDEKLNSNPLKINSTFITETGFINTRMIFANSTTTAGVKTYYWFDDFKIYNPDDPVITATSPLTGVPIAVNDGFDISFSNHMDQSTLTPDNIKLTTESGEIIDTSMEMINSRKCKVVFNEPLVPYSNYKITFSGVKDIFEKELIAEPIIFETIRPKAPEAKKVEIDGLYIDENEEIVGKHRLPGDVLEGRYEYFDFDGEIEDGTIFRWLAADSEEAQVWSEVYAGITDSATGAIYTISEEDIDKFIKFEITPKNAAVPTTGQPVSSMAVLVRGIPVAKNLRISGTLKAGETVSAAYDYFHPNGDGEDGSTYRWFRSGQIISGETSKTYKLSNADVGENISFEVTPRTNVEPTTGIPVRSEAERVGASTSNSKNGSSIRVSKGSGPSVPIIVPPVMDQNAPVPSSAFVDVPNVHWASKEIEEMVSQKIAKGIGEKHFGPDTDVSRAEFTAFIIRALKLDNKEYNSIFDDIASDSWYADTVQTAVDAGLISGNNNKFRPNDPITREEMTKIIMQAYKYKKGNIEGENSISDFVDKEQISDWAVEYVASANELGFVQGMTEDTFAPKQNATRAQALVIIKRLLQKLL